METRKAKRVAIIIEAVMQRRLTDAMEGAGVTGYSILPVLGGSGKNGRWTREGEIWRGSGMVQVIAIIRPEKLDGLLKAVLKVVERNIGVVSVGDCDVLVAERI